MIGPIFGVMAGLVMIGTIWIPSGVLAGMSFFLLGVGPIIWVISTTTLRQTVTPPRLLGRISAINVVAYASRPLGASIGAIAGGFFGAKFCLGLAAVAFFTQAIVILLSPIPQLIERPVPAT